MCRSICTPPPRTGSPHITADTTVASGELWRLTQAVLGRDVFQGTSCTHKLREDRPLVCEISASVGATSAGVTFRGEARGPAAFTLRLTPHVPSVRPRPVASNGYPMP